MIFEIASVALWGSSVMLNYPGPSINGVSTKCQLLYQLPPLLLMLSAKVTHSTNG